MSPAKLLAGAGLAQRRVRVADIDVVWLRSVLEGYDGLASLYGDGTGVVTLTTTGSLAAELDELLAELCQEGRLLLFQAP